MTSLQEAAIRAVDLEMVSRGFKKWSWRDIRSNYHFTGNADDIFGDMFKDIFHGSSSKSTDGFGGHGFHRSSFYDDGSGFSGLEDLAVTDQQALIRKVRILKCQCVCYI